jgi:deoxyribonuclease V
MPLLPHRLHDWDLTPTEAVALQRELAERVDTSTPLGKCELVAGCDVSYDRG